MQNQTQQNLNELDIARSSLADILLVIAKHLKMIFIFTVLMIIVSIYFVNKDYIPEYESEATIFVPSSNLSGSQIARLASQFGITTGGSDSNLDISSAALFPQIAASRTFAERLLNKKFYTDKYGQELSLLAYFTYGKGKPSVGRDTLVLRASQNISRMIEFIPDPPFLNLVVTSDEPRFSKELAESVLIELDNLQRYFMSQKVVEKREYIEQQVGIAETELERLEEDLKLFRENNRKFEGSPALILTYERMMREVEIQKGIFLTLKQQLELTKIEEVQKSTLVQVLDYPNLPLRVSNPKKTSTFFLAGIAGLFLGFFFAFLLEYYETRNKEEADKLSDAKHYALSEIKRFLTLRWLARK
jgi:uncharacterized protein involved in exopolysaccharide biosynthesis